MREYTYGEIMKMQEDALRRVEDMRRKSDEATGRERTESTAAYEKTEEVRENLAQAFREGGVSNAKPLNNIDSDVALLLSVVLLLSEEGADEELLLALLYILS